MDMAVFLGLPASQHVGERETEPDFSYCESQTRNTTMLPVELTENVHWVGVNDRTTALFEGIWPIEREGVTYNAYLIQDDRTALIDPVRISKVQLLLEKIDAVSDLSDIDYIILHHMEQDHTTSLEVLKGLIPDVTIVGTEKTKEMLESFYGITDNIQVVEDGDTLSLGETELQFYSTPFIHWPETMMTRDTGREILFSGDGFGIFGSLRGGLFDDQVRDMDFYEAQGLRYFANVVAKYSRPVQKVLDRFYDLNPRMIAPSHGLVWRENPERIVELYDRWAGYAGCPAEPEVTVVYGSMYGFTERMISAVAQGVTDAGVPVEIFDAGRVHPSYILSSLLIRTGVVVGTPTYEGEIFPPIARVLRLAGTKMTRNRRMALVGSHGWRGGAFREVEELVESLEWETMEEMEFTGKPTQKELEEGRQLGIRFAESIN
jgi:flavorubredoxin